MLMRRKIDLERTVRKDRQEWPEYRIVSQQVCLDPWEDDDCAKQVGQVYMVGPISLEGWSSVGGCSMLGVPDDEQPIRIMEDWETGFIYYRRPVDIERQQKYNADKSFRVTAEEW